MIEIEYIPLPPKEIKKMDTTNLNKFYQTAKVCLGKSMVSPNVPIDLGCASSLNNVHKLAFGVEIGGKASTMEMNKVLENSPDWEKTDTPIPGSIVMSPTGQSRLFPNGHVGIVGRYGILSNNSLNGLWEENYTIESWNAHFSLAEGFPVYYYNKK